MFLIADAIPRASHSGAPARLLVYLGVCFFPYFALPALNDSTFPLLSFCTWGRLGFGIFSVGGLFAFFFDDSDFTFVPFSADFGTSSPFFFAQSCSLNHSDISALKLLVFYNNFRKKASVFTRFSENCYFF
ncbi:hypothetical protein, partial [Barnesiella intestinihominis]|uniref:hypothetical protein n=1 Tax=Barnesiella intestinihominis TaxID=487174 RepID=UPI003A8CA94A